MSLNDPASAPPRPAIGRTTVVVALLLVAGLSIGGTAAYYELRPAGSAGGGSTVTVVDDLGRTVTTPVDPGRVVVLSPSIVDTLYRLGLRDRIVAVGCTASLEGGIENEYSPNQTAAWGLSNASCLTDFPNLNTEGIANLTPGLVLASTLTSQVAVGQLTDTYHLPVVLLAPTTLEGIVGDVRLVSEIFPSAASASTALEATLESTLATAAGEDANLSTGGGATPGVLLSYYFDAGGYYTYGPGSFGASLIDLAGGSNVASGVPLLYAEMNATAVLDDQPAFVLYGTSWNDPYLVAFETPDVWPTAPYWAQLTGTKIPIDVTEVTEPSPSMILELPHLENLLHPASPSG